jgi:hypothetical protein
MSRFACLFPGQGSQSVGMGKDFFDRSPAARELFAKADEALGYSISKLCFDGPEEELRLTANTQPAPPRRQHRVLPAAPDTAWGNTAPSSRPAPFASRTRSDSCTSAGSICRRPSRPASA